MRVSLYPPTGFQYQTEQHPQYHNTLTLEDKRSIGVVLMHRLLREHGFDMGKQLHEMIMFGLVTELTKVSSMLCDILFFVHMICLSLDLIFAYYSAFQNYNHLNRFKDSVDVRLSFADMAGAESCMVCWITLAPYSVGGLLQFVTCVRS